MEQDLGLAGLHLPYDLRIKLIQAVVSSTEHRENDDDCCPLPFPLQDLCLLVVVSDLDCYPTELLASLPRWLRHRLLSVLPALDLGHLEHTPVAAGVDVDEIWESRCKEDSKKPYSYQTVSQITSEDVYQLKVSSGYYRQLNEFSTTAKEVAQQLKLPNGKKSLLMVVSDVLSNTRMSSSVSKAVHQLISIGGDLLFSNLLAGSIHQSECKTSKCGYKVWSKQATSLAVNVNDPNLRSVTSYVPVYRLQMQERTLLTPRRSVPVLHEQDPLKLLSLLTKDCSLQPSTATICIDSISQPLLAELRSERLALDNAADIAPSDLRCTSLFNRLLENVVVLSLKFNNYSDIGLFTGMLSTATASSQLKYFYCSIPNLYMDLLQPLSDLFSLKNFHELSLDITSNDLYLPGLSKLIQAFMAAPCSHTHKLMLKLGVSRFPTSLREDQLASFGKRDAQFPLPSCNARQKVLECSTDEEFTKVLYLLLQLPRIRLKEIVFSNQLEFLHLCPLHPDLQVTKIVINLFSIFSSKQKERIQADLVAIIGMPCLEKVVISGNWGRDEEIKSGIVQSLRSRTTSSPLQKISLELAAKESYKKWQFQALFDAIFSLPHLDNLKLVLGKGFADMIRQPGYEDTLCKSWRCRASNIQLKMICLQVDETYKSKFERLSLITQEISFSTKQTTNRRAMYVPGYGFPGYFDYNSDDDDVHYFDSDDYYGYYNYSDSS